MREEEINSVVQSIRDWESSSLELQAIIEHLTDRDLEEIIPKIKTSVDRVDKTLQYILNLFEVT